jgi:beta-mannanase
VGPGSHIPAPLAGKVSAPSHGHVYWGLFSPDVARPGGEIRLLQQETGRTPAIAMWYQAWGGSPPFPAAAAARLRAAGIVPMITWEAWTPPRITGAPDVHQPRYRLARIASGAFDGYLRSYARQVKDYGGPVMIRPFHEMDGFWYPWGGTVNGNTAAAFIGAWRHVHDLFAAMGVTNVTWVWSVNALSVPSRPGNMPSDYWPGRRYVDWIGISGFNWGRSRNFGGWVSFDEIYRRRIGELVRYRKPIALTEVGSAEVGGDKAAWIRATFARLSAYPSVGALIWYDKRDSVLEDWRIQSSPSAEAAFVQAVATRRVLSAPAALETTKPS